MAFVNTYYADDSILTKGRFSQAEKLRSRAQKQEVWRSTQQLCRYLYYLGRIRAVQLDYTDSKDCLQQAVRKASLTAGPPFRLTQDALQPIQPQ